MSRHNHNTDDPDEILRDPMEKRFNNEKACSKDQ